VWTGLLGGFPVTGSFSRSAVNADAGATSAASPIVAAFFVAAVLRFFTGWLALLPRACVASVVVSAVLRLLDVGFLSSVCRGALAPRERLLYLTVLVAGVGLGIEAGLASGAILGFVLNTWFPVAPQTSAALGGESHM
jgi:SulP family sulfate permease